MPRVARALGVVAQLGALAVGGATLAHADVPETLNLETRGECPSAATIQRQLGPLLPKTEVVLESTGRAVIARVVDGGESFSIDVGGARRQIDEPARDCVERARISAVFITLVLDPPLVMPEVAPPAERISAPVATPGERPSQPLAISLSAAFSARAAPASSAANWGMGPSLGIAIGKNAWEVGLGAAVTTPVRLRFATGAVRLQRSPLELMGRWLTPLGSESGYVGLGIELDLLQFSGIGVERATPQYRVGVGGRGSLGARIGLSPRLSGFAELSGAYFPQSYTLEVAPDRVLGETPSVWFGLAIGVIF